jgi:hypothetical protein
MEIMRKHLHFILAITLAIGIFSCRGGHYNVNISNIKVDIKIKRLDKDLFEINSENLPAAIPTIKQNYAGFLQLFSYVINAGNVDSSSFDDYLMLFRTDMLNNEVYVSVIKTFPNLAFLEEKLSKAFRYYKYYFPDNIIPNIYTCISGFNASIIIDDSVLAIGLDRYLGANCGFYPRLGIYTYLSDRMTPQNIVPDCAYAWISSEWDFSDIGYETDNVLTEIIHYGKLKYFEKCMLPTEKDELIFGFSPDQMKFCRNNESQMWTYLLEHDLLFSTDHFVIRKLTGESPFTSYFTNESPGQAAVWIGFRIIESYMKKNPEVKLADLMQETDIQRILSKAKYSPK